MQGEDLTIEPSSRALNSFLFNRLAGMGPLVSGLAEVNWCLWILNPKTFPTVLVWGSESPLSFEALGIFSGSGPV